jgi:PAS domain S-box-containing protein
MFFKQIIKEKLFRPMDPAEDSLMYWRERILSTMLACGLLLSPFVFPPTLIMIIKEGLWPLAVIDVAVLIVVICLFFSRRLSYSCRAACALFLMLAVGTGVLSTAGFISGGPAWLFGFAVMTALLLGLKVALISVMINLIILCACGYFIHSGPSTISVALFGSDERALTALVNFILLNAVAAVSVAVMVRGLEATTRRQQKSAELLHRKIFEHQRSVKALKESEANYRLAVDATRLNESRLEALLQLHQMTGESLGEIAGITMEQAVQLTNSSIGYIAFLNEEETILTMHAWSRHALEQCRIQDKPIVYTLAETGLWGEAIRQRRPIITNDYAAEKSGKKGIPEGHVPIRRHMNVPCFDGDRIVVLAGVGNKDTEYDESDIRQLKLLMIGMWRIVQRKRAEDALRLERERFQTIFQQAPFGMVLVDKTGRFTYVNPRFTEIFGYDLNDVPDGRTWFRSAFPDTGYRKQVIGNWLMDLQNHQSGGQRPRTFEVTCKDGRKKMINFIPVRIETGENLVSCEDISERLKLEDQLRHAHKMEAVGTLAGGVAHDFNNLLQGIGGYAQILLMDKSPEDPEYSKLKGIEKSVERAAQLVRQLLLFSRKAVSDSRNLNLDHEVKQAVHVLERTIPKMIEISIHSVSRLWAVKADALQIEQMLLNLGTNAADAMPEGGRLTIQTRNLTMDKDEARKYINVAPGNYVQLTVSDTGTGMDPETVNHIFEPFFTTKGVGKGTGLGLASVYGIVKTNGGYIRCDSRPGKGTIFKMIFPAVTADNADAPTALLTEAPRGGTETILVVDDEADIRDLASQMLTRFGYAVVTAASGEEALAFHSGRKVSIDLTILDLSMPGMGGYRCLEQLLKTAPSARILIASGYSADASVTKALEFGASGFIGKPFHVSGLLNSVRDILDETRA